MEKINEIQSRYDHIMLENIHKKPVISVCGLVNVGKSYLLNMLTHNIDQEYFKTADQRETTENKELETDEFIYRDTPGLDSNDQDDANAWQGVYDTDIVLFVHQLQGALDPKEVDFLGRLIAHFGDSATDNIVLVISKIDKESVSKVEEIEREIRKQCLEKFGREFTVIDVSNTRYKSGIIKHKDGLVQKSHIDKLHQHIRKVSPKILLARQDIRRARIDSMLTEVEDLLQELHNRKSAMQQAISDKFHAFNEQMSQLQSFLSESSSNFRKI